MSQYRNSPYGMPGSGVALDRRALIELADAPGQHVGRRVAGAGAVVGAEPELAGLVVLEVLLLLAALDAEAELHAVRAHQLGQLVAELQRVVVGVDVRRGGPEVAHLAAAAPPVEQLRRQLGTRRIRGTGSR